jgi:hypothetical protein
MKTILFSAFLAVIPLACGGGGGNEYVEETDYAVEDASYAPSSEFKVGEERNENPLIETQKLIRNANLRFETQNLEETYQRINLAASKHQAYFQRDTESKDYQSVFRSLTVRVPQKNFESLINDITTGITYFDMKEIGSRDVTEQFIDLEARLKAKKSLEERYLDLLKKATKISEILEIERELTNIREEIESKEGQLKYLQSSVSFSTIEIHFYKKMARGEQTRVSYWTKIKNGFVSGWNGMLSFFVGLLHVWPFIIILVLLILYLKRKLFPKK